jgi:serine phosphatase RsbU (regulator of sigma subunit)
MSGLSHDEAVAFVRELQEAANAHDLAKLSFFYGEYAVCLSPVFGEVRGRKAVLETWDALFTKFPDSALEVSDVFTDGEKLVYLGTITFTDTSGWFGLPPTGAQIYYRVTLLCTMDRGRIVREERIYDTKDVMDRLEKARLDRELETAAEVQSALLPRTVKSGAHWDVAGDSIACRAIGGDFFELLELPSGDLAIALGDAEGMGTPAALVAATLHGMFVADARTGVAPAEMLCRMSDQLAARYPGGRELAIRGRGSRYATFVCGVLSPDGRFTYANAGHNPPVLFSGGEALRLTTGGPVLGAFAQAAYEQDELRLSKGDTVLMFSDGVTETVSTSDEEFGEERLLACANQNLGCSPPEMLDRIFQAVREFVGSMVQADDVTATITRYR